MSRKTIVLSLFMVLMITALVACDSEKGKLLESGDITKENISQVCEILNEAGRKLRKCLALTMPIAA